MPTTVRVRVTRVKGTCAVHSEGDEFTIEGPSMFTYGPVCVHALPSILHFAAMLREGVDPVELGLAKEGRAAYVVCPDPGPPLTEGGRVLFELEPLED